MTYTIHRGANEIGGICVEACTDKTRIILDIGMPLMNADGSSFDSEVTDGASVEDLVKKKILPDIPALYGLKNDKQTAILISHAHQDHYGLIGFADKKLPVYIGKVSHKLIELSAAFTGKESVIVNPVYFKTYEPFKIGDIEVTPYLMDHACCDAYAFLLSGNGKTLFYSGDFRGHGRKWRWFYKFLHIAPKNVDYMLMEGTTLSRKKQRFQREEELERQFLQTFKENKGINLVFVSGQNIDRLVTIYRACKRSAKTFVIDFYIANVLSELALLGYGVPNPSAGFSDIKVFFPSLLTRRIKKLGRNDLIDSFKKYKISLQEINSKTKEIVMTVRTSMEQEVKNIRDLSGGTLIYSMWEGYKDNPVTERFLSNVVKRGAAIKSIHTSGHADYYTLQKMYNAVQPKQLIPIHTTRGDEYQKLFSKEPETQTESKLNLFNQIEELGKAHEKSGALPDSGFEVFAESVQSHLEYICEKLGLSAFQATLFADMITIFDGYLISIKSIAEFIGCKLIKLIKYFEDFNVLEERELISINNNIDPVTDDRKLSFYIETETLTFMQKDKTPNYTTTKNLSFNDFFMQIAILCENCVQRRWTYQKTLKKLSALLQNNLHLEIVKKLKSYALSLDDELILLRFCHYLINLEEENMDLRMLRALYYMESKFIPVKMQLKSRKHILQEKRLIQNVHEEGFGNEESFCLTDKAREELLSEFDDQVSKKPINGIKPAAEIPAKSLFYPDKIEQQIIELTSLLDESNFSSVQKRLSKEGMRTGFACLFSGGPGTGKTETVYQIARQTGRGIMQVDIADSKSMWFGESEKKIKEVFSRYRSAVKRSSIVPILLLNEADAIIGKRQILGENRSGTAQTENTIQNIILQEIENLNGILIATTNLAKNMDKAFERRFLYKIEFEKPTLEARKSIWQAHIPALSTEEVDILANQFTFSGGQIENIARRRTIAEIIYGSSPAIGKLIEYCNEEITESDVKRRIGF